MTSWSWSEQQLQQALESNPALQINEQFSQPAKKRSKAIKRPKIELPPMKFYENEQPIRIWLPVTVPSLNRILRMNRWERKKQEDEFRDAVRWELMIDKILGFRSPVILNITIFNPVMRHRDRDNYLKWVKDSIKGIIIVDDDPRYLAQETVEFAKGKAHIELRIIPVK